MSYHRDNEAAGVGRTVSAMILEAPLFAIAPTDGSWFSFHREMPPGRVVNFWTPTPWGMRRMEAGQRFYFLLKAPIRKVGGYGTFVRYAEMSAWKAWEEYGTGNGVSSRDELVGRVRAFRAKNSKGGTGGEDPDIGCIELADAVFLDEGAYVDPAACGHAFPPQVVMWKSFPGVDGIAARLGSTGGTGAFALVDGVAARRTVVRKDRKGQSAFRQMVLRNYGHRCCILGGMPVELLEAAHIQPYVDERSNHPQNGLCLRVDLHRLFDEGLISVTLAGTVAVSARLAGTEYERLEGLAITLPVEEEKRPSSVALAFQRGNAR